MNQTKNILQVNLDGVKVDVVDYSEYRWIDNPMEEDGMVLASPKDIAAMKVNAIMGMGSRKDFVDLYVLLQHYSLAEIFDFYKTKYPGFSEYRALLSMTYFDDAEAQTMPKMLISDSWQSMRNTIVKAVHNYQN